MMINLRSVKSNKTFTMKLLLDVGIPTTTQMYYSVYEASLQSKQKVTTTRHFETRKFNYWEVYIKNGIKLWQITRKFFLFSTLLESGNKR